MRKGQKHSEETKLKMSLLSKGRIVSEETRLKISQAHKGKKCPYLSECNKNNKGKKLSKETIKKIIESRKGYRHSKVTIEKIRLGNLGKPSPNKGIPMSEEQKQKIRIANTGKPSYNKGKPMTEEQKIKIGNANRGCNNFWFGKKRDAAWKEKISKKHIERMKNLELRKKISLKMKVNWEYPTKKMLIGIKKSLNYSNKKSYQEKILFNKVNEIYKDMSIIENNKPLYNKEKNIRIFPDIIIEKFKLAIEYDGLHFHKDLNRDIERDKNLVNLGYKVIHYRGYNPDEFEIINDVNYMLENETNGLYKENNNVILNIK